MRALLDRPLPQDEIAGNTAAISARATASGGAARSLLVFAIAGERMAIEADAVHRVVPFTPVRRVPHRTNRVFRGIANIAGELTLVVSLPDAVGSAHDTSPTHFIVTGSAATRWAFPVDAVEGVRRFDERSVIEAPATVRHARDGCSMYLVADDETHGGAGGGSTIAVLDPNRLASLFAGSLA
jgi:chemotaxis signal transduction protein